MEIKLAPRCVWKKKKKKTQKFYFSSFCFNVGLIWLFATGNDDDGREEAFSSSILLLWWIKCVFGWEHEVFFFLFLRRFFFFFFISLDLVVVVVVAVWILSNLKWITWNNDGRRRRGRSNENEKSEKEIKMTAKNEFILTKLKKVTRIFWEEEKKTGREFFFS